MRSFLERFENIRAWITKKWWVFLLVSVMAIVFTTFFNEHVIQGELKRLKPCPENYCEDIADAQGWIRILDNQTKKVKGEIEVAGLKSNTAYLVSFDNKLIPFALTPDMCSKPFVWHPWGKVCYLDILNFDTDSTGSARKEFIFPLPSSSYLVKVIVKIQGDNYKHVLMLDSLSFDVFIWDPYLIVAIIAAIAPLIVAIIAAIAPITKPIGPPQHPEESARKILSILVYEFKLRAGGTIQYSSLRAFWFQLGYHNDEDLKAGIKFAITSNWIKVSPSDPHLYHLTEQGFSKAGEEA